MSTILPINIGNLLHLRGIESSRVELKESWNEGPTGGQVLRTICAFANDFQNLNGGYIVLGVSAEQGVAQLPPAGISPNDLERIQQWIRGRCNTLDPVYQPVLSPEIVDGRHILVIWAPASDTRPHQAPETTDRGAVRRYYVRLGAETVEAKGPLLTQLLQLTAKVPFDDRKALEVPIEKIREARVREFLSDIQSGLLAEPEAREVYRRMLISSRVNGTRSRATSGCSSSPRIPRSGSGGRESKWPSSPGTSPETSSRKGSLRDPYTSSSATPSLTCTASRPSIWRSLEIVQRSKVG